MNARLLFFSGALLMLAGCSAKHDPMPAALDDPSGPPPRPPLGRGGGGGGGDGGLTGNDGGACNAQPNGASPVNENDVGEALPPAIGGTITTGTYWLTAVNYYTGVGGNSGPTGRQFQETINYAATTFDDVLAEGALDGGLGVEARTSGAWSTAGAQLSLAPTCPPAASVTYSYSVTGTTLHVLVGQDEYIYTLR
jgi:hypothetical protein